MIRHHAKIGVSAALTALLGAAAPGCGTAVDHDEGAPGWMAEAAPAGLGEGLPTLTAADTAVARLGWSAPPQSCRQIYRIDIDYDRAPMNEEPSTSYLAIGRRMRDDAPRQTGPVPPHTTFPGHLFYEGVRVGPRGTHRDMHVGPTEVGPAAPTAACYERTWDPMEDALTLGWPALTGRPTAVGETWAGARVEGRCNKTACVSVEDRSGSLAHDMECVTDGWRETLVGIYRMGEGHVAAIESSWEDGHGKTGIWTERRTLVSVESGRPVWSRTVVHHGFLNTTRTWTMTAVDDCAGSPAASGWTRPDDLVAEAERVTERFTEEQTPRRKRKSAPPGPTRPPGAKSPDAKSPDAKAPDTKAPKVPDAKAPDAKAPDAKAPAAGAPEPPKADPGAPDPGTSKSKAAKAKAKAKAKADGAGDPAPAGKASDD